MKYVLILYLSDPFTIISLPGFDSIQQCRLAYEQIMNGSHEGPSARAALEKRFGRFGNFQVGYSQCKPQQEN